MKFGTIIVDPPWNYQGTTGHVRLSGYSDQEYGALTTTDLRRLPIGPLAADNAVLLLWTTWPFLLDAAKLCETWGFQYVTGLPWVKTTKTDIWKAHYGVGYWGRGCTEPILIGKRGAAYRTNHTFLLSPAIGHSRKPDSIYELAESFPGPRLELFARTHEDQGACTDGWYQLGDECVNDGADIRARLAGLLAGTDVKWEKYRRSPGTRSAPIRS
jgi:N6-adenosine-specific RNA methylase IME4